MEEGKEGREKVESLQKIKMDRKENTKSNLMNKRKEMSNHIKRTVAIFNSIDNDIVI